MYNISEKLKNFLNNTLKPKKELVLRTNPQLQNITTDICEHILDPDGLPVTLLRCGGSYFIHFKKKAIIFEMLSGEGLQKLYPEERKKPLFSFEDHGIKMIDETLLGMQYIIVEKLLDIPWIDLNFYHHTIIVKKAPDVTIPEKASDAERPTNGVSSFRRVAPNKSQPIIKKEPKVIIKPQVASTPETISEVKLVTEPKATHEPEIITEPTTEKRVTINPEPQQKETGLSKLEQLKKTYNDILSSAYPLLEIAHNEKVQQIYVEQAQTLITFYSTYENLTDTENDVISFCHKVIENPTLTNCIKLDVSITWNQCHKNGLSEEDTYSTLIAELVEKVAPAISIYKANSTEAANSHNATTEASEIIEEVPEEAMPMEYDEPLENVDSSEYVEPVQDTFYIPTSKKVIKAKDMRELQKPCMYKNGNEITLEIIAKAIAAEAEEICIPVAFEYGRINNGGALLKELLDCLIVFHPDHKKDYYNLAISLRRQGNATIVYANDFGISKNSKKLAHKENAKSQVSGGWKQYWEPKNNSSTLVNGLIGGAIGAIQGFGGSKAKQEEENMYYTILLDIIKRVIS